MFINSIINGIDVSCVSAAEDINDTVAAVDEQVEVQTAIDDVSLESNDNNDDVSLESNDNNVSLGSGDDADVLSAGDKDPNFNMGPSCSDYGGVSFWASTEKNATGTVHVTFILKAPGGNFVEADETLDLVNGSVSWGGEGNILPKGSYTVQATYSGDDNYRSVTLETPDTGSDAFNVPKSLVNLTYTSLTVNEKGNIVVNAQLDAQDTKGTPYVVEFFNKNNGRTETFYRQFVLDNGIIVNERLHQLVEENIKFLSRMLVMIDISQHVLKQNT